MIKYYTFLPEEFMVLNRFELDEEPIDRLLNKIYKSIECKRIVLDIDSIKIALEFIIKHHANQKRYSGDPYYHHPVEVAYIIMDYYCDTDSIIAALLHDIVEDTNISLNQLGFLFGDSILYLVDKLTKLDGNLLKFKLSNMESSYKLLQINKSEDNKKALTIKLIDRLHNMRTIKYISNITKQKDTAKETLLTFVPIARHVGIKEIELELTSIALRILNT